MDNTGTMHIRHTHAEMASVQVLLWTSLSLKVPESKLVKYLALVLIQIHSKESKLCSKMRVYM